jgi:hypothetical protein
MKSVDFPESNIVMGAEQPEYNPLYARKTKDGAVTSGWQLQAHEDAEFIALFNAWQRGEGPAPTIYFTQLTFNDPLQPINVSTALPPEDAFAPPPALHPVDMPPMDVKLPPAKDALPEAPSIESKVVNKLAAIAERKGMSGPILWALDPTTKEKEGITVCHFVRMETQHLTSPVDGTKFATLDPRNDPRLVHLAECFTAVNDNKLASLAQVLPLVHACLKQVQAHAVMQNGTARYVGDVLKLVVAAARSL